MSINQPQRDAAYAELQEVVSKLQRRIANEELQPAALILACRKILDLWIVAGGESTDDAVISFLGIESQSDHVLGGSQVKGGRDGDRVRFEPTSDDEAIEVGEIAHYFKESFASAVVGLADHLDVR
ncbi:hypothetical protein [Croceicoccus sediminis]|uniref:hypothetical protein n=1 Tax=Croceicoccus sediminis TaxID=2571150 RepID=UPI0011822202|nr:hypothetical protein [Croceicoccus sediminis]